MHTISISKFKATCLAVLERVRKTGESLLITKHGVPIAQVLPAPPPPPPAAGRVQVTLVTLSRALFPLQTRCVLRVGGLRGHD